MARQLQLRRGTTAENDAFTGAEGEVTVDTQRKELRIHDGQTPGGMRTITLNPGDVPPDNGVDYIVESNHYTNYTDPYGNVCANYYIDIYKSGKTHIEADGVSHNSSSYVHYIIDRNNNIEVYGMMGTNSTIALPVPMRDTNYYVNVTWDGGKSSNFYPSDAQVRNKTTTSFNTTMTRNSPNVQGTCWEVKGKIRTN